MKIRRRDFLASPVALMATARTRFPREGDSAIAPVDLRCEYLEHPLGIDTARPRLGWRLQATRDGVRGQRQRAYRVLVAASASEVAAGRGTLWDSGKVVSPEQLHVVYQGRPLSSGQRCHWKVRVWDDEDRPSSYSAGSWWEMGLLAPSGWAGTWIDDGTPNPEIEENFYRDDPAPLLRKSFLVDKRVKRARLYAAGLGYYELRLNGRKVSDHVLNPAWTSFDKRVLYTTHDVTELLRQGANALGAMLGNGWYNPLPLRMWGRINVRDHLPTGRPRLIAQLNIDYADGTTHAVVTDGSWKTAGGPIARNSVYLGEAYDARREQPGWDRPEFDDAGWGAASAATGSPLGPLRSQSLPPIRVTATLRPVTVTEAAPGVFVFDLGQNFAGWARLRVQGPRGATVEMRLGELLNPDGTVNGMTAVAGQIKRGDGGPGAPGVAYQTDSYTLKGEGVETYTPRFTFHGFRYVEVRGFPGEPNLDAIDGLRLNTDVEPVGSFSCSNERFDRIHEMVRWTLLSNLFSVQSDCPAREKFQYGGDIVASSEMASFNCDMATFYAKTVRDHEDAARAGGWLTETAPYVGIAAESYADGAGPIGWGLAHPLLVAQLYQYYGDVRIVRDSYDAARRWVELLRDHADGYIVDRCIGDHESLDPKPIALTATAHFHQAARLMERLAGILERDDEAERYRTLAERIRAAFISRFLDAGTGRFDLGTQACQATALYMDLVPDEERESAVERMVDQVLREHDGHVATGIFGTKYLLESLTEAGRADVAYQMVNQRTFPGWGHMLEMGATTLWEHWELSEDVYSHNHPMFGSVGEWLFKALGGIKADPRAVGFDRFSLEPSVVGDLTRVETRYESVRGPIVSSWRLDGDRLALEVEVPVNATARVRVPTRDPSSVTESGGPASDAPGVRRLASEASDAAFFELGSGHYALEAAAPRTASRRGSTPRSGLLPSG